MRLIRNHPLTLAANLRFAARARRSSWTEDRPSPRPRGEEESAPFISPEQLGPLRGTGSRLPYVTTDGSVRPVCCTIPAMASAAATTGASISAVGASSRSFAKRSR